jgi:Protein of unknown function (DUF3040)
MLSERERQVLGQIEARLALSDPKLAAKLSRSLRLVRLRRWLLVVLGWLALVGAGIAGWWIVAVLLLGPLVAVTVAWLLHEARRRRHPWRS